MAKFAVLGTIEATLRRWSALLTKGLTFAENVYGTEIVLSLEAGETKRLTHDLNLVPTRFIILSARGGVTLSMSTESRPTQEFFYIKNVSSTETFTGKIMILP